MDGEEREPAQFLGRNTSDLWNQEPSTVMKSEALQNNKKRENLLKNGRSKLSQSFINNIVLTCFTQACFLFHTQGRLFGIETQKNG